ncbi:MAG: ABC transporter permease, partial [Vicinamibacteria bacterium]|nr:ABC transporter permease [Vicinamibacteria bacterium]
FPFHAMFWTPLGPAEERDVLNDASDRRFGIVARLSPGATLERAARETSLLARRSAESEPLRLRQPDMRVRKLRDAIQNIGNYRMPVLVLQFAVLFVLSIASLNLANLLMARNAGRKHEFAVRLALGAGTARLTRQLVVESMLLGLGGCLVSLPLAYLGFHALAAAITWRIPGLTEAGINAPVLAFTMIVALATSLAFGLAPAALASRSDPHVLLASGAGRATLDRRRHRLSGTLVVAEVGLAVLLLTASGMMIHAIFNLTQVNPGFNTKRAVAISFSLPGTRYPSRQSLAAGLGQTIDRIRNLPGVEAIGAVSYLPLIGYNPGADFTVVGQPSGAPEQTPRADYQPVTPGYFKAMGIALRHGRAFTERDMKPQPDTAIVNQTLARRFWPGGDAIGRHIRLVGDDAPNNPLAIVGIVGDVQQYGIGTPPRPEIYVPLHRHSMTLIVRTAGPPGPMMAALQGAVKQLTHSQADLSVRTLEHVVAASIEKRRVFAWLLGAMAALALALSVMGIYAVISHRTAERTREVGIRMALGARAGDVRRLVVVQALTLTAIGVVGGLLTASAATRVMKRLLFGVGFVDAWTFMSVVVMLVGATLVACYWPARRATRIDPMEALRCQ